VIVDDENGIVLDAEIVDRAKVIELLALIALLITPLQHRGPTFERRVGNANGIASLAGCRVDKDVESADLRQFDAP
jgi:hypothetical protein